MRDDEFNAQLISSSAGDGVTAAADLGRRDAERKPSPYELDTTSALVVSRVRNDEDVEALSLERFLAAPLHPRGAAVVHDPADFAAYVMRLAADEHTTLWAELEAGRIVAVLDDHADADAGGWRQHTITLRMQEDVDWAAWMKLDGKLVEQNVFAEHIEQMSHCIVSPDAADMLEMITSFHAMKHVTFRQQVNITSGDVQLTYEEQTSGTAGTVGHIEVPRTFTVQLSPWVTVNPVELTARLRWRIQSGSLAIGYSLLRPDRARNDAFDAVVRTVRDGIDEIPLYLGAPPAPVSPLR